MKFKKIILVTLLGIILVPSSFSSAQSSVSAPDLIAVENLVQVYNRLVASGKDKTDPEVVAARQAAMDECDVLSSKILPILSPSGTTSRGSIIAKWTPGPPEGCVFAEVAFTRPDGFVHAVSNDSTVALWNEIKYEGVVYNKEVADERGDKSTTSEDGVWWLSEIVGWILTTIFNIITSVLLALASLAGYILSVVTDSVTTATQPDMVKLGWTIIRDFMNMLFILALIVISLATILRVESYNYKSLLARLIIMALLINFSRVIAENLIAVADFVTQIFVSASNLSSFGETIGNLYSGLVTEGRGTIGFFTSGGEGGASAALAKGVLKLIAVLTITVSFLALAGLLFIRLIGLWILTILSPIAFAMNILPATKEYAKQWWSTFIKYLIWAPVAMFFLYIGQLFYAEKGTGAITNNDNFDALFIAAFFWAAVLVAKQAGMVGSQVIIGAAEGTLKKAGSLGAASLIGGKGDRFSGGAAGWALRKVGTIAGVTLTPDRIAAGWDAYTKKRRSEDYLKTIEKAAKRKSEGKMFTSFASPEDFFRRALTFETYKRGVGNILHGRFNINKHALDEANALDKIEKENKKYFNQDEFDEAEEQRNDQEARRNALEVRSEAGGMKSIDRSSAGAKLDTDNAISVINEQINQLEKNKETGAANALKASLDAFDRTDPDKIVFDPNSEAGKLLQADIQAKAKEYSLQAGAITYRLSTAVVIPKAEKTKIQEAFKDRQKELERIRPALSYEATLARNSHVAEEKKKLEGIDEASELQGHLNDAMREKNLPKLMAVAEKMAADYNDNEFFNAAGLPSGFEGVTKFHELLQTKMGMGKESAAQWLTKLGFVNESRHHWDSARVGGFKNGRNYLYTESEHALAAYTELSKGGVRDIVKMNRLGYGGETPNPDGSRTFKIGKLGRAIIKGLAPLMANSGEMRHMDANAMRHLLEAIDKGDLKEDEINPKFVAEMRRLTGGAAGRSSPTIIVNSVEDAARRAATPPSP